MSSCCFCLSWEIHIIYSFFLFQNVDNLAFLFIPFARGHLGRKTFLLRSKKRVFCFFVMFCFVLFCFLFRFVLRSAKEWGEWAKHEKRRKLWAPRSEKRRRREVWWSLFFSKCLKNGER